jgi:hypothetical protein
MDAGHSRIPADDPQLRNAIWLGLASFLLALISYNFVDIDLWHEMALIRESLVAGHLITADPYAYTPTVPWIDHEWGAGAIAYLATKWLGSRALIVVKLALAAGTGICCLRCAGRTGADFRLLAVCAPLAIFLAYLGFFTVVRAQAYSFFFTALLLLLLQLDRNGSRRWIVTWLLVFPLWLNLHGGFVVGLGLLGLHTVEQILRRNPFRHVVLVLAAMCLEVSVNPYGTAYLRYLRHALTMPRPYIPEWWPLWYLGPCWIFAFLLALALMLYALLSQGWRRMPGVLLLSATAVEAALHRKLLPFFAIAWLSAVPACLGATSLGGWLVHFMQRRRQFCLVATLAFTSVCLIAAVRQKFWQVSVPQPLYPVGAVQYLAEQSFHGNLFTPFRLGAYVSWKLYPGVKVSLDSRYEEVYPDAVVRDVFAFYDARHDWELALSAYPTDVVLVPRDSPACEQMQHINWSKVYSDRQFLLYARPGITLPVVDRSSSSFAGNLP